MRTPVDSNLSRVVSARISVIKQLILARLIARQKRHLPKRVSKFCSGDHTKKSIISRLQSRGASMIPYDFTDEYSNLEVPISYDPSAKLKYAEVRGRRVYFPQHFNDELIVESVRIALTEQDPRSPHRYLPTETTSISGGHAILCGASDGIYAMSIIDRFDKISLFEPDVNWRRPLELTLRDSLQKVEIVSRAISDHQTSTTTTIDSHTAGQSIDYLQADIEGSESRLLRGASGTLSRSASAKISICCYHTADQEAELTASLQNMGFLTSPSPGYVLMWMQYPLRPPYFRRAVIYATRNGSTTI